MELYLLSELWYQTPFPGLVETSPQWGPGPPLTLLSRMPSVAKENARVMTVRGCSRWDSGMLARRSQSDLKKGILRMLTREYYENKDEVTVS